MKTALNWVAFTIVTIAIILMYGCWSRPKVEIIDKTEWPDRLFAEYVGPMEEVPAPEDGKEAVDMEAISNSITRDVFADNFDYVDRELDKALYVILLAENAQGDTNAVGDVELTHKAYGLYQIRQPYLDDVNKLVGKKDMRRVWGKDKLTIEDMRSPEKSRWVVCRYLKHYGTLYERKTAKRATVEVYARIHNGGPNGWMRPATNEYGKRAMRSLE